MLEFLVPIPIGFRPIGDLMENLGVASYPLESVVASGRVDLDVHPVSWRLDLTVLESNNIAGLELVGRVKLDNHEDGSCLVCDSVCCDSHAVHPWFEFELFEDDAFDCDVSHRSLDPVDESQTTGVVNRRPDLSHV